ncbi:MAG: pyridoxal phosphate-dependent aminotransferase, partial [Bdellovibrionales bacterium]|nr:pyridoxal phosphate-dependent aminotransferase [Bdellovibrionales bacterium]
MERKNNSADHPPLPGFRPVPRTGVIYVMTEAGRLGFQTERQQWANLGQGAPETGPLPGSPQRLSDVHFSTDEHEYAPVVGLNELRDAVANLYNQRFRKGKASQYTRDNVAIASGGRLALTRLVSTIGKSNVGHFLPDYTAYEELLDSFGTFVPMPILSDAHEGFTLSAAELEREILGRGLSAVLLSNPCNPTGQLIRGETLQDWVGRARQLDCALIFDEFYSHYIYEDGLSYVSAAEYVEDVNRDPVIIFDGLTKNWRYPGFRVSWTVGPPSVIEAVA